MKWLANIKAPQLLKSQVHTPLWEPPISQVKPPGYPLQVVPRRAAKRWAWNKARIHTSGSKPQGLTLLLLQLQAGHRDFSVYVMSSHEKIIPFRPPCLNISNHMASKWTVSNQRKKRQKKLSEPVQVLGITNKSLPCSLRLLDGKNYSQE